MSTISIVHQTAATKLFRTIYRRLILLNVAFSLDPAFLNQSAIGKFYRTKQTRSV